MAIGIGQDARLVGVTKMVISALCVMAVAAGTWRIEARHKPAARPHRPAPALVQGFLANPGLFDARVAYLNRNALGDTYVLGDGRLLHALPAGTVREEGVEKHRVWVIVERAAASGVRPVVPSREMSVDMSYIGPHAQQAVPLHSYEDLNIAGAWPGIDLAFKQTASGIERVYTVQPGARADQIQISLDGATDAKVVRGGDLNLSTGVGTVSYRRPSAYQIDKDGRHIAVPVTYRVLPGKSSFGFAVGRYDQSSSLIIDPVLQGTYLGYPGGQSVYAMTVDPVSGDVLAAGFAGFDVPRRCPVGFNWWRCRRRRL